MIKRPNKSIPLSVRQEETLTRLAAEHGSYALTGPTVGMPSWRRLVAEIAAGDLLIRRRRGAVVPDAPAPAPVAPAAPAAVDQSPPLWWPREEDGSLKVFAQVSGARADQCAAMGLELSRHGYVAQDGWLVP